MPTTETILLVTLAGLALSASPGPSMLYVLSRSIGQSRNAGLMSAAGLAVGGFVHVVAAALGLAAVFNYVPIAYTVIRVLGALYLIYLGVQMLLEKDNESDNELEEVKKTSLLQIFNQGVLVEVLNPKTILFFVAFLPQFVYPDNGSITLQMLILGTLVPLTAIPSDLIVAMTGGTIAQKLSENRRISKLLTWLGGIFLIGLGLRIFFDY